jgi:hypothetical protein
MPGRFLIVTLIAAGALCCPFRCLSHSADSVAFFSKGAQQAEQVTPLSPPAAQNESGCICRGAINIDASPTLDDQAEQPLFAFDVAVVSTVDMPLVCLRSMAEDPLRGSPPLSGRALRTQHSSFLF